MSYNCAPDRKNMDPDVARAPVHAGDFLWRPLKVKILWICSFSYWGGVVWAEARPDLLSFFHTVLGGYIGIFLCPPIVFMVLIGLFLRTRFAQIDTSGWDSEYSPGFHHQLHQSSARYGEFGGPFDPTLDPLNPQSGMIHQRHMGWLDD